MIGLWALFAGCLPHSALSRAADVQAVRYELSMSEASLTPGVDVAAQPDAPEVLTRQYVRTFADGSSGWLVCLETSDECAELRTFPTGEVLTTRGSSRLPKSTQRMLIAVWPLLSPRLDTDPGLVTSWPLAGSRRSAVRAVATGGWTRQGATWHWSAVVALSGDAPTPKVDGRVDATVQVDGDGTVEASWATVLPICSPEHICQNWASAGRLTRRDTVAPRTVAPCPQHGEDASRAPLCLADGTPLEDAPAALDAETLFGTPADAVKAATVVAEPP